MLSWLGIGIDGSWGQMIAQAKDELSREPIVWWNLAAASARAVRADPRRQLRSATRVRDVLDPRTLREHR